MKSDFLIALTQLAAERNLPREKVMSAIEAALVSAFKKDSVTEGRNISVKLDPGSGDIKVDIIKTVVESVEDPLQEIDLYEAQSKFKKSAKVGDTIPTENIPNSAGRIAAQTAKQVVLQRLREAEKEIVLSEYAGKEGEIITVTVQRIEPGKVIVDTGRTEALLPISQQVSSERYRTGSKLKVLLQAIDMDSPKGPELIMSRTDELLLKRLFEQEVPEIFNGAVEIMAVARESGSRSKVSVRAKQDGVDPVGSCVGLRGVRIQSIVNELQGEKIDILEWNKDVHKYIANALSPSQVLRVNINVEENSASAIVPDRHLSLAIGKEGQNARLAAKLTGWRVDIQSDQHVDLSKLPSPSPVLQAEDDEQISPPTSDKPHQEDTTDPIDQESLLSTADDVHTADIDSDGNRESGIVQIIEESGLDNLESQGDQEFAPLDEDQPIQDEEETGTHLYEVPEDIWSISGAGYNQNQAGMIRFAEDIEDLKGGITARRSRRKEPANTQRRKNSGRKTKTSKKRR